MNAIIRVESEPRKVGSESKDVAPKCVRFGRAAVFPRTRELYVNGQPVEISEYALEILLMLIEADGQVVSKSDLFKRLWPKRIVEESNLRVHICNLRKVLAQDAASLRTVPNSGYRITAPLWVAHGEESDPASPAATAVVIIVEKNEEVKAALDLLFRSGRVIAHGGWLPALREEGS